MKLKSTSPSKLGSVKSGVMPVTPAFVTTYVSTGGRFASDCSISLPDSAMKLLHQTQVSPSSSELRPQMRHSRSLIPSARFMRMSCAAV